MQKNMIKSNIFQYRANVKVYRRVWKRSKIAEILWMPWFLNYPMALALSQIFHIICRNFWGAPDFKIYEL